MAELSKQSKLHEVHMHTHTKKTDDMTKWKEETSGRGVTTQRIRGDHEDIQVKGQAGTIIGIKITDLIPAPILNRGITY